MMFTRQLPDPIMRDTFPKEAHMVQLWEWVEFERLYGMDLDRRKASIITEDDFLSWNLERAVKAYSHYTGIPLSEAERMDAVKLVSEVSPALLAWLTGRNGTGNYRHDGRFWEVHCPRPKDMSPREHAEFLTDLALIEDDIREGEPAAAYEICAMFIRLKGESNYDPFKKDERAAYFMTARLDMCLAALEVFHEYQLFKKRLTS
jgi:hypothetical protein